MMMARLYCKLMTTHILLLCASWTGTGKLFFEVHVFARFAAEASVKTQKELILAIGHASTRVRAHVAIQHSAMHAACAALCLISGSVTGTCSCQRRRQ